MRRIGKFDDKLYIYCSDKISNISHGKILLWKSRIVNFHVPPECKFKNNKFLSPFQNNILEQHIFMACKIILINNIKYDYANIMTHYDSPNEFKRYYYLSFFCSELFFLYF